MPTYPIQLKRSGTASATPSSLVHGELAINYNVADGKLFWKDSSNVIQSFTFQAYALSSHSHGNITNAGAIGSTANLPIITTTSGVLTTGSFGTSAATFCEGNDSRLSDTRTPTDGSVTTAKLANDAVTYAKIQNVSATDRLLGRSSAGSGDVEEVTCTAAGRALLSGADAAAQRTTLSVQPTASPAFTGAATFDNTGNVVPLTVTNAGTANSFVVNDASGDTSPFVIDASGNVGIGTSSPSNKLSVSNAGAEGLELIPAQNANESRIQSYNRASAAWNKFSINCSTFEVFCNGGTSAIAIATTAAVTLGGQLLVTTGSGTGPSSYKPGIAVSGDDDTGLQQVGGANTISLVTQGTERVRVDASGRVGIGVTPASAGSSALQVRGDVDIFGNGSDRSVTYNVGVGDDGITGWYRAKIAFVPSGAANNISQHISFWNKDGDNGGSTLTERMRIANDGKIYGYSVYATTVGATNRDLFIDSGGLIGYVSSIRASKTNIAAIDDASWLLYLTPVSFHYRRKNEDGTYSDEADGTLDYGLIAEEVEPVAPELCFYDVVDGEPQLRGVHYSKLITPMLRYIQQLEARIAALEERVNA